MTVTTLRSPLPSLYSDTKIHNRKSVTATQFYQRRLKIPLHACYSNTNSKNNKKFQAIDLQELIRDSTCEFDSKDSTASLPRPLTSDQLSNLTSEGSRLRVAYQGVRGAYSEFAAEKAYPNCEPVPCEQFDTAFETQIGAGEKFTL